MVLIYTQESLKKGFQEKIKEPQMKKQPILWTTQKEKEAKIYVTHFDTKGSLLNTAFHQK